MIERLTHKSYMVKENGPSYTMKETKDWLKKHKELGQFLPEEDNRKTNGE